MKKKRSLKYLLLIMGMGVLLGACSSAQGSTAAIDADNAENSSAASESDIAQTDIVALSPEGPLFPSLDVDIPEVPAPEYLKLGVDHSIVATLQSRLMELGFMDNDEPTHYFGAVTDEAVKIYQRQNGLTQDGIVGPETLASIMSPEANYYAAKSGESGSDITRIQQRLYELGYLAKASEVNGTFDDATLAAVEKMQQVNGIAQDGTVGRQTMNLIYSEEVKANMLAYGEKSEVVQTAQERLYALGYLTSTPDGVFGDSTATAIREFQSRNDLVVDGYLGPGTRDSLNSGDARPFGLTIGDQSDSVTKVQQLLVKWGYLSNKNVTGYYGETTQNAVKALQTRNGLGADGMVGSQTMALITGDNVKKPAPEVKPTTGKKDTAPAKGNTSNGSSGNSGSSGSSGGSTYSGGGSGVSGLLSAASSRLGCPYVWGAKGPNSFDCSGFVYWCLNQAGVHQSYMTSSGWASAGRYTRISNFSDLQAGDIIVVSGHVGICAGGGTVYDASSSNGKVVHRSLGSWWQSHFIVGWRIF